MLATTPTMTKDWQRWNVEFDAIIVSQAIKSIILSSQHALNHMQTHTHMRLSSRFRHVYVVCVCAVRACRLCLYKMARRQSTRNTVCVSFARGSFVQSFQRLAEHIYGLRPTLNLTSTPTTLNSSLLFWKFVDCVLLPCKRQTHTLRRPHTQPRTGNNRTNKITIHYAAVKNT